MVKSQAHTLAHELTIEYIRANPEILKHNVDSIDDIVDIVADINTKFLDALHNNRKFDTLYL